MIRRLLRALGLAGPEVPCWCGTTHPLGYWHDPSHGRIDRDIQDHVRELLGYPEHATKVTLGDDFARVVAIEETLQSKRERGERLWWEKHAGAAS